jgi:hypothetical protein
VNPAATAGRAAIIATIAIAVEENIEARHVAPRDPVPTGRALTRPARMDRATTPTAATTPIAGKVA